MKELFFSIIIPTYNRRNLLRLVLDGLKEQSYTHFEVIVVAKPSGDGTEDMVNSYKASLKIKLILQQEGYVTNALNIGLKNACGDVVGFLDDDAVPAKDLLEKHAEMYEQPNVAAVAGDAIPSKWIDGKAVPMDEPVKVPQGRFQDRISYRIWDKPLPGTENYFVCISKGGTVNLSGNFAYWRGQGRVVNSFLGVGANMTVLSRAVKGFSFESAWISGSRWEQFLAWHIWKGGGAVVFNPKAIVYHVLHGQTLSRGLHSSKARLFMVENELFFYRLYGKEKALSCISHLLSVLHRAFAMLKNDDLSRFEGIVIGNFLGLKLLVLRRSGNDKLLLADLERIK